jgi:hypothetical protein
MFANVTFDVDYSMASDFRMIKTSRGRTSICVSLLPTIDTLPLLRACIPGPSNGLERIESNCELLPGNNKILTWETTDITID